MRLPLINAIRQADKVTKDLHVLLEQLETMQADRRSGRDRRHGPGVPGGPERRYGGDRRG